MKRLVSTLNLSKEDWLRYRKCGITGTDAGAILGLNPYRSAFQVYHDKISDIIENIDNEAMRQGRDLEDYVAQRFSEETGFKVRRANAIYQSEEHSLLLADFDRLIVGQKAGLECKTVSPFSADKWADGKIPAHYMAQVDHYLAVSGFDCWYVAALIFGRELVIHKIVADKQVISDLIDKEERFWTNHVVPQIPPAPNGCDCDTQQINQLYEVDNRDKTADLSALHGLLDKRQELSDQIEQMEQEKTAIEQQVKLKMQDAAYGTAPGYKVSWVSSESKRVDSQRLRKEQPDIFNQYSKNVSSRRFTSFMRHNCMAAESSFSAAFFLGGLIMATENPFVKLFAIDFKDHLEVKKSGNTELKYVSWAYAWAEVKKLYPTASYEVKKFNGLPYVYDPITGFMVYTTVMIEGVSHEMWLPVLDDANKAMKAVPYTYTTPKWDYNPQTRRREKVGMEERTVEAASMFDVNKAIMRCLVKNLAMFGLGLYVYAGEDLPEDAAPQPETELQRQPKPKSTSQKQEQPPMPCICARCNQPIKRVKLKDGSIMQAAEFAATHEGMCADCYKATRLNVA